MKKIFVFLLILFAVSCKKSNAKCYWTNGNGDFWDTKPSDAEIQQWEQACSCTITIYKECPPE